MERLADKRIVDAAAAFVRILIRVPEAYVLLRPYETTRPGFLVLDADGRRVDSIDLRAVTDAEEIARRLTKAATAPAKERFLVRFAEPNAAKALQKKLRQEKVSSKRLGRMLEFRVAAGGLDPRSLGETATVVEPVTVRGEGLIRAAGTWYSGEDRIYVASLLLDPKLGGDLEARRFDLPGVGQGPPAARVPLAVQPLPGVLSVFPDLFGERITVVGRKGATSWNDVVAAMEGAGATVRPVK